MISSTQANQPKAKILVGTPCYGGMCFVGYVASLITSKEYLRTKDIQLETCFLTNESLIPRGRNTIVAKFMTDPSFTHLLFIDGDITFNHISIERLINHDKDLVGALYPKKGYTWEKLKECQDLISAENFDENAIKAKMMSYTVNYTNDRQVVNGLLRVKHIGTGFFLVKREVILKMMKQYPELKYDDDINILTPQENEWLYALFDCEVHQLGPKRHYLSEDYLFCKRWQDMGGEIHADVTIPLTHTGTHSFVGNYLRSIQFEPVKSEEKESITTEQTNNPDELQLDISPSQPQNSTAVHSQSQSHPQEQTKSKLAPPPINVSTERTERPTKTRLSPADIGKMKIF